MFAEELVSLNRSSLVAEVVAGCGNPAWSASVGLGLVPFERSDPVNKVTVTLRDDFGWCVSALLYSCIMKVLYSEPRGLVCYEKMTTRTKNTLHVINKRKVAGCVSMALNADTGDTHRPVYCPV